jgi:hypothetical protein
VLTLFREGGDMALKSNMTRNYWIAAAFSVFLLGIAFAGLKPIPIDGKAPSEDAQDRLSAGLRIHLERLTSSEMEGRLNSTAGYRRAADYCAQFFNSVGLEPGWTAPGGKASFYQNVRDGKVECVNIIARLSGSDPRFRNEYITLGAHLDHLGKSWWGKPYPGANDDASGCAAVLEAARILAEKPPKRTVIFVLFTAEEFGHIGSQYFVRNPPVPLDRVLMNVNVEQIGSRHRDYPGIFAFGPLSQRSTFEAAGKGISGIPVVLEDIQNQLAAVRESDTWSFLNAGEPAVILSSGGFPEHHRFKDSNSLIDFAHLTLASRVIIAYVRELAEDNDPGLIMKKGE